MFFLLILFFSFPFLGMLFELDRNIFTASRRLDFFINRRGGGALCTFFFLYKIAISPLPPQTNPSDLFFLPYPIFQIFWFNPYFHLGWIFMRYFYYSGGIQPRLNICSLRGRGEGAIFQILSASLPWSKTKKKKKKKAYLTYMYVL